MRRSAARTGLAGVVMVVAVGLGLVPGRAAASVVERVLYSFGGPDGAGPLSGVVVGRGGVLYGTTDFGGASKAGYGNVFALMPGPGGYTQRVLVSFRGRNGAKPDGIALGSHGDLFGTTTIGGAHGQGIVFELVPSGAGYRENVLYSFTGGLDGGQPSGAPVLDARGDIFGVTQFRGAGGQGVIFELTPGPGGYTERVLHAFAADAGQPQAGLARAGDGTLYGTLYGASPVSTDGTVFRLRLAPAGPVFTILHIFGGPDGANPIAALTVDNTTGVIYGTTQHGGNAPGTGIGGGTVFALTPSGAGYTERVLHAFTGYRSGLYPEAPLLLTSRGDLYGTTTQGGSRCHTECGVIFKLVPGPAGGYAFHLVYAFAGAPDGSGPQWSGLATGPGGRMFGTTESGGTTTTCYLISPGCGTVYQITP